VNTLRLAVLDMAGTTVSIADAVPAAYADAFRAEGVALAGGVVDRVRGQSKRAAVAELLRASGNPDPGEALVERVLSGFRASLRARSADGVAALPGALDTVQWFRAAGIQVALTTGFDAGLAGFLLERLGWDTELFAGVVTDDDVDRGRPHPDLIFHAMRLAGVTDPGSVLVAGDTASDLEAANRAGAGIVIGVTSGAHDPGRLSEHRHDVILPGVAGIPAWLETHRPPTRPEIR
jgi:phosphonatase-like hydrolase